MAFEPLERRASTGRPNVLPGVQVQAEPHVPSAAINSDTAGHALQRLTDGEVPPASRFAPPSRRLAAVQLSARAGGSGGTIQRLVSGNITAAETGAEVQKAPSGFGAPRFRTLASAVDGIDISDLGGDAGTLSAGDVAGGIRIDQQGDFDEGGLSFFNVQAQANDPPTGLTYPAGTQAAQKGTSLGEVHVDTRLPDDAKVDVRNRTRRLLKSSMYSSVGDRTTYPRPVYKIVHED